MKQMKNKMKTMFKIIFSNKKTKIMFCLTLMSFVLLISVTFAWFVSIIDLPNSHIATGNLDVVVKGYDVEGNFITTIVGDKEYDSSNENMINVNKPLFNIENWSTNSATTCYIVIENSGTLPLDYALTFKVNGTEEHLENLGGFWYRIERLNNLELDYKLGKYKDGSLLGIGYKAEAAFYDDVIKDYISNSSPVKLCSDECINELGKYSHVCTEYNALSRNLVTISHLAEYGTLDLNNDKVTIYRLDIGFRKEAIEERYTSVNLEISGEVYATQKGAILNPDGVGTIFTVTDEVTLNRALDNALPGDTILLGKSITYNGDLIFNKCLSINTYGNDLIVNGNLIFNYVSEHTLKLNLSSGGDIKVLKNGDAGGNLEINTPNSEVIITGNNYTTNVYVEKKAYISVTKAPKTRGLFLSGANLVNKDGDPKDIDVKSNSRITLDYGASLFLIEAVTNATNIEIINYGTINTILLNNMMILDNNSPEDNVFTEYAQIVIDNYNTILKGIKLPTNATPFYDFENENGLKEGNTLIYRQFGALEMSIIDNQNTYLTEDIIDYNVNEACVIQEVEGKDDSLIVYYGDTETEITTIQGLLENYFIEKYNISGGMVEDRINSIKRIVVYSIDNKIVTHADLTFLNGMSKLADLDLLKTFIEKNTIPASQFENKISLKNIVLPDNLTTIKSNAFANSGLKSITIPASVTSWDYKALTGITYVTFNSVKAVAPTELSNYKKNLYPNQYIFVDEASIEDYVTMYGATYTDSYTPFGGVSGNNRIFAKGELTDDGQHVVRKTSKGYELVCYTGVNTDILCGYNLYLNGEEISITSVGAYCYSNIPTAFRIEFMESVTSINDRAFYNSLVKEIDFNNVRYVGELAFFNCLNLNKLDTKRVEEIASYGFASCLNLFSINCPELITLRSWAFAKCRYLAEVKFYKLQLLEADVFNHNQWNTGDIYHNVVRAYFLNSSFEGVTYSSFVNVKNVLFKVFVNPENVESFRGTGCVAANLVYPDGDEVGTYIYEKSFTIDGESITNTINLGEYVVAGPTNNAKFVCYNIPVIDSDFTVPDTATYVVVDENNIENEITKKITTVGEYAFSKIKIEYIEFSFGDSIKSIEKNIFYDHSTVTNTTSYSEKTYYVRITKLKFNNVENIANSVCANMIHLAYVEAPKLKVISSGLFKNCVVLKKVDVPAVEEIYDYGFQNCAKLLYLEFPSVVSVQGASIVNTCTALTSITFGPNLIAFDCTAFLHQGMKIKEIIFESDIILTNWFTTSGWIYPDLRIYVDESTIGLHHTNYANNIKEYGEKVGDNWVYNYDETVSYNLGEYRVKEVEIDGIKGLSICSYNWLAIATKPDYKLPDTINGQKVIRIGYRAFYKFDFSLIDTSENEHRENFEIPEYLIEIGQNAFRETNIRVSKFKNVKYIYNYAFYKCTNIYAVYAPELLFIGNSGFSTCSNIYHFEAKKLIEIENSAFGSLTKCKQFLTNIQKVEDVGWLQSHSRTLITFATDPGSYLSGGTVPANYRGTLKLTNSTFAGTFTNKTADFVYAFDEVLLTDKFDYPVYDTDGELIYNIEMYRYAINPTGSDVTIIKCLNAYSDSDVFEIPSRLDNRTVTTIGTNAFSYRSELANKTLVFGDSIKLIKNASFQSTGLTGILNLNNVEKVENQAFSNLYFESVIAPKLTDISGNHVFFSNSNLVSFYFNNMETLHFSTAYLCPNLKYIYSEKSLAISTIDNRHTDLKDYTFVLNCDISSVSDIKLTNWDKFHDITIYVPYTSLKYYQEAFADTSKYVNFTILPIGVIMNQINEETGLVDQFVLVESEGEYNYSTGQYERVFELLTIITQSSHIVIPDMCEVEDGSNEYLPITKLHKDFLKGQPTIKSLTLPAYLRTVEDNIFNLGENLENIYVKDASVYFDSDDGVLYTKNFIELVCYPKYHDEFDYTIPNETKVIRSYAFKDCANLKNVIVGLGVEVIGLKAFEGTTLATITFTSENPPFTTGIDIFDKENIYLTVYVPVDSIDLYKEIDAFTYMKLIGQQTTLD